MTNKVQIKRSNVAGKAPQPADLEIGELALNFKDQKIYTKEPGNTIVELGGDSLPADAAGVLTNDGAGALSWAAAAAAAGGGGNSLAGQILDHVPANTEGEDGDVVTVKLPSTGPSQSTYSGAGDKYTLAPNVTLDYDSGQGLLFVTTDDGSNLPAPFDSMTQMTLHLPAGQEYTLNKDPGSSDQTLFYDDGSDWRRGQFLGAYQAHPATLQWGIGSTLPPVSAGPPPYGMYKDAGAWASLPSSALPANAAGQLTNDGTGTLSWSTPTNIIVSDPAAGVAQTITSPTANDTPLRIKSFATPAQMGDLLKFEDSSQTLVARVSGSGNFQTKNEFMSYDNNLIIRPNDASGSNSSTSIFGGAGTHRGAEIILTGENSPAYSISGMDIVCRDAAGNKGLLRFFAKIKAFDSNTPCLELEGAAGGQTANMMEAGNFILDKDGNIAGGLPTNAAGVLTNDGTGVLSWGTAPAGGGGTALPADAKGHLANDGAGALTWEKSIITNPSARNFQYIQSATDTTTPLRLRAFSTTGQTGDLLKIETSSQRALATITGNGDINIKNKLRSFDNTLSIGPDETKRSFTSCEIFGGEGTKRGAEIDLYGEKHSSYSTAGIDIRCRNSTNQVGFVRFDAKIKAFNRDTPSLELVGALVQRANLMEAGKFILDKDGYITGGLPDDAAGVLTNDGAGALSWAAAPAGGGGNSLAGQILDHVPASAEGEDGDYIVVKVPAIGPSSAAYTGSMHRYTLGPNMTMDLDGINLVWFIYMTDGSDLPAAYQSPTMSSFSLRAPTGEEYTLNVDPARTTAKRWYDNGADPRNNAFWNVFRTHPANLDWAIGSTIPVAGAATTPYEMYKEAGAWVRTPDDLPVDAAGVLTNDGTGGLTWAAGGTTLPADAAGYLDNDGSGALTWKTPVISDVTGLQTALDGKQDNLPADSAGVLTNDGAGGLTWAIGGGGGGGGGNSLAGQILDHVPTANEGENGDTVVVKLPAAAGASQALYSGAGHKYTLGPNMSFDMDTGNGVWFITMDDGSNLPPAYQLPGLTEFSVRTPTGEEYTLKVDTFRTTATAWYDEGTDPRLGAFWNVFKNHPASLDWAIGSTVPPPAVNTPPYGMYKEAGAWTRMPDDLPADAAGVLTNDGTGTLSWAAAAGGGGGAALPADAAGHLANDGSGTLTWESSIIANPPSGTSQKITSLAATDVALTIESAFIQTADLTVWQKKNNVIAKLDKDGKFFARNEFTTLGDTMFIRPGDPSNGKAGSIFIYSGGTISDGGGITLRARNNSGGGGNVEIYSKGNGHIEMNGEIKASGSPGFYNESLKISAHAGQPTDLTQWLDDTGRTVLAKVDVAGKVYGQGAFNTLSDIAAKDDVTEATIGLNEIMALTPRKFRYKKQDDLQYGFVAQEVQEVIPEAVTQFNDEHLGLKETHIIPALVNAIKELKAELEEIKNANRTH